MVVQELGGPKLFLSCAITPKLRRGSAEGGDVALERIVGPHCGSDLVLYVVPTGAQKTAPDDGSSKLGGNPRCSNRSEEHTSELQTLMRISYAVFCLKQKNLSTNDTHKSRHLTQNM